MRKALTVRSLETQRLPACESEPKLVFRQVVAGRIALSAALLFGSTPFCRIDNHKAVLNLSKLQQDLTVLAKGIFPLQRYELGPYLVGSSKLVFVYAQPLPTPNYLIVCTLESGERLGLPDSELPTVLDATEAMFGELPGMYRQGNLPVAIANLIHVAENSEVFYFNLDQLRVTLPFKIKVHQIHPLGNLF